MDALMSQTPRPDWVVVVDSGSTDDTVGVAKTAGARLISFREPFDHGLARNRGAEEVLEADALIFLVQDAVPQGESFICTLAESLAAPGVGAVTARQVGPREAFFTTRSSVCASPFFSDRPRRTGPFAAEEREAMDGEQWRREVLLDNIACAVRADLFRASGGFAAASHGEDVLFAYDLLCSGWSLVHQPAAVVEHGHDYDHRSVQKRYRADAVFFREQFGLRVRSNWISALKGFLSEVSHDRDFLRSEALTVPQSWSMCLRLRWAQVMAQREGSRGPLGSLPVPRKFPTPEEMES